VTIPKWIAERYGIEIGDEIDFVPAGQGIRIERSDVYASGLDRDARLEMFDRATARQQARQATRRPTRDAPGWRRGDVYERGSSR
jgi:bifunctional DNA-binding transcriptional regulator/antitoxin component of YhaV-PrlF toxin-antitoxin module